MLVDFVITLVLFVLFDSALRAHPRLALRLRAAAARRSPSSLTLGLSLLLSALNVRYRDVSQALPFMLQLWFFLSPVAFALLTPAHAVGEVRAGAESARRDPRGVPLGVARDAGPAWSCS